MLSRLRLLGGASAVLCQCCRSWPSIDSTQALSFVFAGVDRLSDGGKASSQPGFPAEGRCSPGLGSVLGQCWRRRSSNKPALACTVLLLCWALMSCRDGVFVHWATIFLTVNDQYSLILEYKYQHTVHTECQVQFTSSNIIKLSALGKVQALPRLEGGGPRVVVSTAAFHVRGSVPGIGGLKETKNVSSPSTCESQYCGGPQ